MLLFGTSLLPRQSQYGSFTGNSGGGSICRDTELNKVCGALQSYPIKFSVWGCEFCCVIL